MWLVDKLMQDSDLEDVDVSYWALDLLLAELMLQSLVSN